MQDYLNDIFCFLKPILGALLLLVLPAWAPAQVSEYPRLEPLPEHLDSLPEYQLRDLARQLANQAAQVKYARYQEKERCAQISMQAAELLAAVEADSNCTKAERKDQAKVLKTAQRDEKNALGASKKADALAEEAMLVAEMDSAALLKTIPKLYKKIAGLIPEPPKPPEAPIAEVIGQAVITDAPQMAADSTAATPLPDLPAEPEPAPDQKHKKAKEEKPTRPPMRSYDPAADVMLNPPAPTCVLSIDTRDAFSGEQQREVQKEELFRFTNPALRSYYTDRDHMICQASLAAKGGVYVLQLQFTINDANAQRSFGSLPRNGVAIIKLLDGETLTLYNLRADEGKASP
ncbi:MAG: hypothetical protein JNK89_07825, partial [Saprospiraceae bacterium]|nr:hypothetical protein [Saprospiraceae bacterium]